jgi:DNA-binding SARP family transcriptional activator/tetratricopeptide (TPR) repeat protein
MARLSLSLLGPFQATLDGEPITRFESDKVRALLAYLTVEADCPHRRETLVGLLWPDWPEGAARRNLSHALANLRRAIGDDQAAPPFLLITPQTIQFNCAADYCLDVAAFSSQLSAVSGRLSANQQIGKSATGSQPISNPQSLTSNFQPPTSSPQSPISILQSAVDLYRGSFLEGFSLKDCPAFDDWVLLTRERLQRQTLAALQRLAAYYEQRGEVGLAVGYTRRQVELEPWQEEAQRRLIRLLALSGQRSAALAQYEACCRHLRAELGVEPERETTALYERIRDGEREPGIGQGAPRPPDFLLGVSAYPLPQAAVVPFVARERELARLDAFLDRALAGRGGVAFVTGDPGSGKTALVAEFARRALAMHPDLVVVQGNGNAYTGLGDPYLPFREIMQMLSGDVEAHWAGGALTREHAVRLWHLLPAAAQALVEAGPDLVDRFVPGAALLARAQMYVASAGQSDRAGAAWLARLEELVKRQAILAGAAEMQQAGVFEQYQAALFGQVSGVLHRLAGRHPLVLVLDDLQWADAGSISLLFHLGRRVAGSRILIVGAYRPEDVALGREGERHPLEPVVHEFQRAEGDIQVDLNRVEGRPFVDALLDSEPNRLGAAFRDTLYRHTGGHPLFTVELLRGLQERGDLRQDQAGCWVEGPALDWDRLPARVEATIAERIGRLPEPSRALLAAASVEGEDFTAEAVARGLGAGEEEVIQHLSGALSKQHRLVVARSLRRRDGHSLSGYRFRHYLFQKYLYQSLDEVERARLHEAIGNALEVSYGAGSAEVAVQLAHHFEAAGLAAKAADYLFLAGNRAVQLVAGDEAVAHYRRGLELLKELPESAERAGRELRCLTALGTALRITRSFSLSELGPLFAHACELCQQVGGVYELFGALDGLACNYFMRAELHTARELMGRMLELACLQKDPDLLSVAHGHMAVPLVYLGELLTFREHKGQALAFYHPPRPRTPGVTYELVYDAKVVTLLHAAWAFWCLGYPEQAEHCIQEALPWARELAAPWLLCQALGFAAEFRRLRQEVPVVGELAEAALALAGEQEIPFWEAWSVGLRGWAWVRGGQPDEGWAQINRSLDWFLANEAHIPYVQLLCMLADAARVTGRIGEGLAAVDEGLALARERDYLLYEPELFRLKGELLLQQDGNEAEAEACFRRGIESAQRQQARSWELRAAIGLARLWRRQGQVEAARGLLAEVYNWFTEGFDTADLREAKALLEALA